MPPITDNGIVHLVASRSVNEVLVHLLSILQTKVISVFAVVDHSGEAAKVHTHAVIFNVTERENGQTRALQPRELFVSQNYATNVYRSELAARLKDLGYTIERGEFGQPEIKGYTKEYLEASSLRREQVKDHMRASGLDSPAAAQIAAHRTRDSKQLLSPEEVLRQHRELAAQHGNQADRVVAEARQQVQQHTLTPDKAAQASVTYARDHLFERSAVENERAILAAALARSMGEANFSQVRQEFDRRVQTGEFRAVEAEARFGSAGQRYTTAAMLSMERETIGKMLEDNLHADRPFSIVKFEHAADELVHPEQLVAARSRGVATRPH